MTVGVLVVGVGVLLATGVPAGFSTSVYLVPSAVFINVTALFSLSTTAGAPFE